MFTGIVEGLGTVKGIARKAGVANVIVDGGPFFERISVGDSVSVNGICLTAVDVHGRVASFDVSSETMARTDVGNWQPGDKVNLERALMASGRFGGHFVTGHIDCLGKVKKKATERENVKIEIEVPTDIMRYVVAKGSIAADGISLTVAELGEDYFTTYIIPHTLKATTLGIKKVGDSVNVEMDVLGKYVEKLTSAKEKKGRVTEEFLKEHGFA